MCFRIIYTEKRLYHGRLYNAAGHLLFWTTEHATKQPVIAACEDVRRNMRTDTPIYDG
jgi:hypothetical protein